MDYNQKYNKYKYKYQNLKHGGNGNLILWKQKYPNLSNLIDKIKQPEGLNYVCDPDSVRGKSARYILERIVNMMNNNNIDNLNQYYTNIVNELTEYDIDYHNKMYDLMIISLQCMIYVETPDDEKNIFNPG